MYRLKYNEEHQKLIDAIENIYQTDDRPHEGLISKLVNESGKTRAQVNIFLKFIRIRSYELTDSPANQKPQKRFIGGNDDDDDDE